MLFYTSQCNAQVLRMIKSYPSCESWRNMKKSVIKALLVAASLGGSAKVFGECRMMISTSSIPKGYHPVTVDWKKNDPRGDQVCISKTEGNEIRFIPWLDFSMPSEYYVLYEYPNPSTTFNGCRRWNVFMGSYNCIDMYPSYQMRRK